MSSTEVLMITYRRPEAVALSLPRLLDTVGDDARVWLWHNGDDADTLEVVRSYADDPRVARFHHSPENLRLRTPTMWLWENSSADYLSKVDDDCLESPGWVSTLRTALEDAPQLGVVGAWRHYDDEYVPALAEPKMLDLPGGHRIMRNHWVQGSGYLVRRADVLAGGPLPPDGSFTSWCLGLARQGKVNGWYHPFVFEDHMDDPRSEHALIRTDEDLRRHMPLSAARNGVTTVQEWDARNRRAARMLQAAPLDLREYRGVRRLRTRVLRRGRDLLRGRTSSW